MAPRPMARYLERRAEGHRPLVVDSVGWVAARPAPTLDRGDGVPSPLPVAGRRARSRAATRDRAGGREVLLASGAEVRSGDRPGAAGRRDDLAAGHATGSDQSLALRAAGPAAAATITLRARQPDSVLSSNSTRCRAFVVYGAGLAGRKPGDPRRLPPTSRTASTPSTWSGGARRFAAINNTVTDFNAHFKINGERGPLSRTTASSKRNTLSNGSARQTGNRGDADRHGGRRATGPSGAT